MRRLASGAAYLTVSSVFGRALGLISFPILTHFLTPSAYGVAALASSMIGILTVFSVAGQDTSLMRHYFDEQQFASGEIERFFHRFALISGIAFGIMGATGWFVYTAWMQIDTAFLTAPILGMSVLAGTLSVFAQTSARLEGRYVRLSFATILSGVTGLMMTIACALLWRADEIALMIGALSAWVIIAALPLQLIAKKGVAQSFGQKWQLMRIGFPMLAVAPGFWVVTSSDRWFLAAETSVHDLGIYLVAVSVATLGQILTSALMAVWNPELLRNVQGTRVTNENKLRQVLTVIMWAIIVAWFGVALFGDVLIKILAAEDFQSASAYVPWLALGYMIYGINQFFGMGFMIHQRTSWLPGIWLVGVLVSFTLNFTLIPNLSAYGAVVAQILSFFSVAILTWGISYRWTPFQPHWATLIFSFLLFLVITLLAPVITSSLDFFTSMFAKAIGAVAGLIISAWLTQRHLDPFQFGPLKFGRKQI